MIFRLLIVATALLTTAAQAKSPGDGMVYITGVTVVHPEREGAAAREPHATVVPYLIPGFTDAKYFSQTGARWYGFSPVKIERGAGILDAQSDCAHGRAVRDVVGVGEALLLGVDGEVDRALAPARHRLRDMAAAARGG